MDVVHLDAVLNAKIGGLARNLTTADGLIDRTDAKLGGLQVANTRTGASFDRVGAGAHTAAGGLSHAEKETERAGRGALAATGLFNRLGRSMAFASGAFIGGAAVVFGLKSVVDAAKNAQESEDQLRLSVTDTGQSWTTYGRQVDETIAKQERLSAFSRTELRGSFSTLERATGSVTKATKEMSLAEDVARGRRMGLSQATMLVIRASSGMAGILRRVFPDFVAVKTAENALTDSHKHFTAETRASAKALDVHATALKAVDMLTRKYSGSATSYGKSGAGATDKFAHSLTDLEASVGSGVIPVLSVYLGQLSTWMEREQKSGKLQKDVTGLVHGFAQVLKTTASILKQVSGWADVVARTVGGWGKAFQLIVTGYLAYKFVKLAGAIRGVYDGLVAAGIKAQASGALQVTAAEEAAAATVASTSTMTGAVVRYTTAADVAAASTVGIGTAAVAAEAETVGALGGIRAAFIGLGALRIAPLIIPILLQQIPKSSAGQRALNKQHAGFLGHLPILGGLATQAGKLGAESTNLGNRVADSLFGAPATGATAPGGRNTSGMSNDPLHDAADRRAARHGSQHLSPLQAAYAHLDTEIKKLLGLGTAKKGGFRALPNRLAIQLANAQAAAAGGGLPQLQKLEETEKRALAYLENSKVSGRDLVAVAKERATLSSQIAATEAKVSKELLKQKQTAIGRSEEKILGLGPGGALVTPGRTGLVAREHKLLEDQIARSFGGKSHSLAVAASNLGTDVASLLHKTNQQLIAEMKRLGVELPKSTLTSLQKVNEVLKNKFIPPDVRENIRARLQQIEQMLKASSKQLSSNFKPVHSTDIVKGLGLDRAQKLIVEGRVAQALAHGGTAPTGPAANGIPLTGTGKARGGSLSIGGITIELHGVGDKNAKQLMHELGPELQSWFLKHEARNAGSSSGR